MFNPGPLGGSFDLSILDFLYGFFLALYAQMSWTDVLLVVTAVTITVVMVLWAVARIRS